MVEINFSLTKLGIFFSWASEDGTGARVLILKAAVVTTIIGVVEIFFLVLGSASSQLLHKGWCNIEDGRVQGLREDHPHLKTLDSNMLQKSFCLYLDKYGFSSFFFFVVLFPLRFLVLMLIVFFRGQ